MRLIDAEWIKDRNSFVPKNELHTVEEFMQILDEAPTIDAVPVVRCRECKHRDPEDYRCDCGHDILWQLPRWGDWFCADGERKEGDA